MVKIYLPHFNYILIVILVLFISTYNCHDTSKNKSLIDDMIPGSHDTLKIVDEIHESFIQWLVDNGASLDGFSVVNKSDDRTGLYRTIYANKSRNANEVITKIPMKCIIHSKGALNHPVLGPILKIYPNLQEGRTPMAIWLLYEKSLGESSFFYPWLRLLPQKLDLPLLWTPEELEELKGTSTYDRVLKDQEGVANEYESVFTNTLFKNHGDIFNKDKTTLNEFMWAWSIIWSRNTELGDMNSWTGYLIPFMDFINHNKTKSLSYNLNFDQTELVLRADDLVEVGDEILRCYIPEGSNNDLFRMFGFIDTTNLNGISVLKIDMDPHDPHLKLRKKWIDKQGLTFSAYPYSQMVASVHGIPNYVMALIRILNYDFDNEKATKVLGQLPDPSEAFDDDFEKPAYSHVKSVLERVLNAFPTTIEEDEKILDDLTLSYRKQLAVEMRLEEKIAIHNSLQTLKTQKVTFGEPFKVNDRSSMLKPKRAKIRESKSI